MTNPNRFKTYTQLEKISERMLSRSVPRREDLRNLETEFLEVLLALAGGDVIEKIQVGSSHVPSLIPIRRVKIPA